MKSDNNIYGKARTISELAAYYGVDVRTFKKWLDVPSLKEIRPEAGRFFTPAQIKAIVSHLGGNEPIPDFQS